MQITLFTPCSILILKYVEMNKLVLTQVTIDELTAAITEQLLTKLKEFGFSASSNEEIKEYLTADEVAEICKVKSLSTLWHWRKQGLLIPEARAGRKPLYKYDDVVSFLTNKK